MEIKVLKTKKGNVIKNPMAIVSIVVGIVVLAAVAQTLIPTATSSIFGLITATGNNLTAAQQTTLRTFTLGLNYVIYLIAIVAMILLLIGVFMPHGKK